MTTTRAPTLLEKLTHITQIEVIANQSLIRLEKAVWHGKRVMVKRLKSSMMRHPEVLERFEREGDVLERLDHPNIPQLVRRAQGVLMREYVDGFTLYHHLDHAKHDTFSTLDLPQTLRVARGLLSALVHAHSREILHLDIKPANIMIAHTGRIALIDFGCAKDLTMESITRDEARLGTPHYMAPEQFRGIRDDPRSDLYSVGAVMYEALMGRPPHLDPFTWLAGRGELPTKMPSDVRMTQIILKALQRDPRNRFEDALHMLEAIETLEWLS
jgi:eukaryotic-like serine/threonine-protein kinase